MTDSADLPIAALIYKAKSTVDVRNSLERQEADCRAAIERAGGRRVAAEPFADENASAFKGNRGPGLQAAMRTAEALAAAEGGCELWVQHSDRLARGSADGPDAARHLVEVVLWARRSRVRLRSVEDDASVGDLLHAVVTGDRNNMDSQRKRDSVRSGKRGQFDRGERLGGPVCDGYVQIQRGDRRARVVAEYALDPEREPVIRKLFDLLLDGLADAAVARELNRLGHRTRDRVTRDGRRIPGRSWTRRAVQDKALNGWYAGYIVRNRTKAGEPEEMTRGTQPAYITPEQFEQLKAMRASRDRVTGTPGEARRLVDSPGRQPSHFALGRLAVCGRCGARMASVSSTYVRKDGSKRRQYVCGEYLEATGVCDQEPIDRELVDRGVVGHLSSLLVDFDRWLERETERLSGARGRLEAEIEECDAELASLADEKAAVTRDYRARMRAGQHAAADVAAAALEQIAAQRRGAESRLRALRDAYATVSEGAPADAMLDFHNALSAAVRGRIDAATTMGEVNERLRELFDAFELDRTAEGIRILPRLRRTVAVQLVCDGPDWARLDGRSGAVGDGFPTLLSGAETLSPLLRSVRAAGEPTPPLSATVVAEPGRAREWADR